MGTPFMICWHLWALFVGGANGGSSTDVCSRPEASCANYKVSSLLQVQSLRKNQFVNDNASQRSALPLGRSKALAAMHQWKSQERAASPLHYFKWWTAGKLSKKINSTVKSHTNAHSGASARMVQVNRTKPKVATHTVLRLLAEHQTSLCPSGSRHLKVNNFGLSEYSTDDAGVQHVLLNSPKGDLQYVAVRSAKVLVADPPICSPQRLLLAQHSDIDGDDTGGELELLDIDSDPLVRDCVKLFHRTSRRLCNKEFNIKLHSATLQVINGFAVKLNIELFGPKRSRTVHDPECVFEIPRTPDADLLQRDSRLAPDGGGRGRAMSNIPGSRKQNIRKRVGKGTAKTNQDEMDGLKWPWNEDTIDDGRSTEKETAQPAIETEDKEKKEKTKSESKKKDGGQKQEDDAELQEWPWSKDKHRTGKTRKRDSTGIEEEDAQRGNDSEEAVEELLDEEDEDGMEATLRMHVDICKADQEDSAAEKEDLNLLSQYRFGHLPSYKGYYHLQDEYHDIPAWISLHESVVPETFSLVGEHPECFPNGGKEVVRDQGMCGSCWAFAAASALMSNLCTSGSGKKTLASKNDRYEMSVQAIMSCQDKGCSGGNANAAHTALSQNGIAKERDFHYRCGGGDAKEHFVIIDNKCTSENNWGAQCKVHKNPDWHYQGIFSAGSSYGNSQNAGEAAIKSALIECGSGYLNFIVYQNFFRYKSGVYNHVKGEPRGGHAVTLLGYGADRDTKYWHILNSWGNNFGMNGYANFLRGTNLANIENQYVCFKGSVEVDTEKEEKKEEEEDDEKNTEEEDEEKETEKDNEKQRDNDEMDGLKWPWSEDTIDDGRSAEKEEKNEEEWENEENELRRQPSPGQELVGSGHSLGPSRSHPAQAGKANVFQETVRIPASALKNMKSRSKDNV